MQADNNHERPHVHINNHGASFAIDTGELLAGDCDFRTRNLIENWIKRHRSDLLQLWQVAKQGESRQFLVERIKRNSSFDEFGFNGKEPRFKTVLRTVIIWHDDEILIESNGDGTITIVGNGDLFIGLGPGHKRNGIMAESLNGRAEMRWT